MDVTNPASIIQLISGQSPLMVLVILLIYQLIREKDQQVKAEERYGQAIERERQERIDAMNENNKDLRSLLITCTEAVTKMKEELHDLKGVIQQNILGKPHARGTGND